MTRSSVMCCSGNSEGKSSVVAARRASNFRDLAGLRGAHGPLPRGRILRAGLHDGPAAMAQARAVTPPAAVLHVFDMRAEREVESVEHDDATTRRHAWPIHDPEWISDPALRTDAFFVASAVRQLRLVGPLLEAALRALADGDSVLFGCHLGKDRSGMVVLALGRLLGVDDDDLIADYCRTGEAYDAAWVNEYAARRGEPATAVARRLAPPPGIPRAILAALDCLAPGACGGRSIDPDLIRGATSSLVDGAPPPTRGVRS